MFFLPLCLDIWPGGAFGPVFWARFQDCLGDSDITAVGNLYIRGVRFDYGDRFAECLDELGVVADVGFVHFSCVTQKW